MDQDQGDAEEEQLSWEERKLKSEIAKNQAEETKLKLDSQEVFEEIEAMLHCYSMKLYSSRKKKIVQDLCESKEE